MKVLWRCNPITSELGVDVRVVDLEGEKVFEVISAKRVSLWKRVKCIYNYLVHGTPIIFHMVLLDNEFESMCRKVANDGK